MGSATVRRFALLAVIVVLASVGWRADTVAGAVERPGQEVARLASPDLAPAPAVRRHVA